MLGGSDTKDVSEKTANSTNEPNKDQTRVPPKIKYARKIHNSIEKKRKDKISQWINKIAEVLPQRYSKKESKNDILERAYCHLIHLRETNDRILFGNIDKVRAERFRELKKSVKKLEEINAAYYKLLRMSGISLSSLTTDLWRNKPTAVTDINVASRLKSDLNARSGSEVDSCDDGLSLDSTDSLAGKEIAMHLCEKSRKDSKILSNDPKSHSSNAPIYVLNSIFDQNSRISSNGSQIQIRPPNVSFIGSSGLSIDNNLVNSGPVVLGSTLLAPPQQALLMPNGQLVSLFNQPQPSIVYSPGSNYVLAPHSLGNHVTNLTAPQLSSSLDRTRREIKTTTTIEPVPLTAENAKKRTKISDKTKEKTIIVNSFDEDEESFESQACINRDKSREFPSSKHSVEGTQPTFSKSCSKKVSKFKVKKSTLSSTIIEKATDSEKLTPNTLKSSIELGNERSKTSNEIIESEKSENKSVPDSELPENQVDYHLMNQLDAYITLSFQDFENHANSPRYSSPLNRNSSTTAGILPSDGNNMINDSTNCLQSTSLETPSKSSMPNVINPDHTKNIAPPRLSDNYSNMDSSNRIESHAILLHPDDINGASTFTEPRALRQNRINSGSYQSSNSENQSVSFESNQSRNNEQQKQKDQRRSQHTQNSSRSRSATSSETCQRESSNEAEPADQTSTTSDHNFLPYSAESLIRQQPQQGSVPSNAPYQVHAVEPGLEFSSTTTTTQREVGNRSTISYSAERLIHSSPVSSALQTDDHRSKTSEQSKGRTSSSEAIFSEQYPIFDPNRPEDTLSGTLNQPTDIQHHGPIYRSTPSSQGERSDQSSRHHSSQQQIVMVPQQAVYPEKSAQPSASLIHQHQPASQSSVSSQQMWQDQSLSSNQTITQTASQQRTQTQPVSQNSRASQPTSHQTTRRQSPSIASNPRGNIFNHYLYPTVSENGRQDRGQSASVLSYNNNGSNLSSREQAGRLTAGDSSFIESSMQSHRSLQPSFTSQSNYPTPNRRGPNAPNPFGFSESLNTASSFTNSSENSHYNRVEPTLNATNCDPHRALTSTNINIANSDTTPNFLVNYPSNSLQASNIPSTMFSSSSSFPPIISTSSSSTFDNNSYFTSSRGINHHTYPPHPSLPSSLVSHFNESTSTSRKQIETSYSADLSKGSKTSTNKQTKISSSKSSTKKVTSKNTTRGNQSHADNRLTSNTGSYSPLGASFSAVGHVQDASRSHSMQPTSSSLSNEPSRSERALDSDNISRPQSQTTSSLTLNLQMNNTPSISVASSSRSSTTSSHITHSAGFLPNFSLSNILTEMSTTNLNDNLAVGGFPPLKFPSNHVLPHSNAGGHLGHSSSLQTGTIDNNSMSMGQNHQNLYGHGRIGTPHPNPMTLSPFITNPTHSAMIHDNRIARGMKHPRQPFP